MRRKFWSKLWFGPSQNLFASSADCIINDNNDYLLDFLEGLAVPERCTTILDWDTAGRVYLDYIQIIKSLQVIQQVRSGGLA